MLTRAHLRASKGEGKIQWQELEEFREGLIALTGDAEGSLHATICGGKAAAAQETLTKLIRIFGPGQVFVELQRHLVARPALHPLHRGKNAGLHFPEMR